MRPVAKKESLDAAYRAILAIRRQGLVPTPTSVAKLAGLTRSTLYRVDPEWVEVLDAIDGKDSSRLDAISALPDVEIRPRALNSVQALTKRLEEVEKEHAASITFADSVYQKLIDQLQYYFSAASQSPNKKNEEVGLRRKLADAHEVARRMESEVAKYKEVARKAKVISATGSKRVISIPPECTPVQAVQFFLDAVGTLIPNQRMATVVGEVIVVCGLPMSGKSTWINAFEIRNPGVTILIEGVNHREEFRRLIVSHLRRLGDFKITCAWLVTPMDECLRRNKYNDFPNAKDQAGLISDISNALELVSVLEPFDSILRVGNV